MNNSKGEQTNQNNAVYLKVVEGERGYGMSMYHITRTHPNIKSSKVVKDE
jgi:hypothetical protein